MCFHFKVSHCNAAVIFKWSKQTNWSYIWKNFNITIIALYTSTYHIIMWNTIAIRNPCDQYWFCTIHCNFQLFIIRCCQYTKKTINIKLKVDICVRCNEQTVTQHIFLASINRSRSSVTILSINNKYSTKNGWHVYLCELVTLARTHSSSTIRMWQWIARDISDISPAMITKIWYVFDDTQSYTTLKNTVFYASYFFFVVETLNLLLFYTQSLMLQL